MKLSFGRNSRKERHSIIEGDTQMLVLCFLERRVHGRQALRNIECHVSPMLVHFPCHPFPPSLQHPLRVRAYYLHFCLLACVFYRQIPIIFLPSPSFLSWSLCTFQSLLQFHLVPFPKYFPTAHANAVIRIGKYRGSDATPSILSGMGLYEYNAYPVIWIAGHARFVTASVSRPLFGRWTSVCAENVDHGLPAPQAALDLTSAGRR